MSLATGSSPARAGEPSSADDAAAGFALYVHWPFCRAKCPYCDFNSHVRAAVDEDRWRAALLRELDHFADLLPARVLVSIFFGGGTPSLMAPRTVAAVIDRAVGRWPAAADLEVTLEANPTSVEAAAFRGYAAAGVNRLSLGVQALDDAALRLLGREHSAAEAVTALELATAAFERRSLDLIYARPGQTAAAWAGELDRALGLGADHLSLYQLTIEPGTRFHAEVAAGRLRPLGEERQAELFELTQELLGAAGLPAYEISNHARPGAACRHNLVYWRSGEWIGIGPGAHGRLAIDGRRVGTRTVRQPERWLAAVEQAGHAEEPREPLDRQAQLAELLMMGLRLVEGVPRRRIEKLAGQPLDQALDGAALERLRRQGLLVVEADRLRATATGRARLEAVLRAILR
jgi:putative oxygen-independent coproporphyrinogen III oxidase